LWYNLFIVMSEINSLLVPGVGTNDRRFHPYVNNLLARDVNVVELRSQPGRDGALEEAREEILAQVSAWRREAPSSTIAVIGDNWAGRAAWDAAGAENGKINNLVVVGSEVNPTVRGFRSKTIETLRRSRRPLDAGVRLLAFASADPSGVSPENATFLKDPRVTTVVLPHRPGDPELGEQVFGNPFWRRIAVDHVVRR
jgi:hypothetical protein